ncbi:phosphatidylserine decarboxylase [Thioalkalivibrio denitrificans]|uniref:Phosphatidylserine decarboxylase proenzyme n=1 Tax=Thioalkalivibrio denitrificans TaxID=108003 RepID=A0A1V3NQG0_9GAMM|nr:archaetidylserine decarboxylase [Thioalkalivibrio denitrificans]OOG27118.1 phosphatidylserine decarboxylase [Thioalkalivibrio denitrificans]
MPAAEPPRWLDLIKSLPLYALPHHAISRTVHALARMETRLKDPVARWFIRRYGVDMSEAAETRPEAYPSFNAFFTRALRPDARPLDDDPTALLSPADSTVSALGRISEGRIIQAKGRDFSLETLLGGDAARAQPFRNGHFITLYLSPRDYHRVHMPAAGRLCETVYVPGRLFSVAPHTVRTIPNLFARNERVACLFDTERGPLASIMVGAINVGSIELVWAGEVTPPRHDPTVTRHDDRPVELPRGAEMGRFNMGSTVILLLPDVPFTWQSDLAPGMRVKVGEGIGKFDG